jgi:hypothetical protein
MMMMMQKRLLTIVAPYLILHNSTKQCVSCEVRTGFFSPENGILHSHNFENLNSCILIAYSHFRLQWVVALQMFGLLFS